MLLAGAALAAPERPNIVYILADDLGYGDLGVYGQKVIQTPHLDRMAAEGVRFTQHYAGSAVCAPSRSALLTGQHTGHTPIRGNAEYLPEGQQPLPAEAVTLAEVLKSAGYRTGAFGKWGLGFVHTEGDPLNQGFDRFYGYNCQRMAHRYYPPYLWDDQEKDFLKGNDTHETVTYAPEVIHEQAVEFIREHRDEPFFLFYPHISPHAELLVPEDYPNFTEYKERFGKDPYDGPDWRPKNQAPYGPDWHPSPYAPQDYPQAAYAVMVEMLDRHVGEIFAVLDELGLSENTIVLFASDNGPHSEGGIDAEDFDSNGILRGSKRDLYEGGIRVPFIAKWPGRIEGGRISDHVSAFWDMMPTFAELAGARVPHEIDGISMVPALLGKGTQPTHDYLYWEFQEQGGKQAVRMGDWKAVRLNAAADPEAPIELYHLAEDPSELRDLASGHPDLVAQAAAMMAGARTFNARFAFPWERTEAPAVEAERVPEGWAKHELDVAATGRWWERTFGPEDAWRDFRDIPRDEVAAFALYTHHRGVLKLSAQFYPLYPDEDRTARLEVRRDGRWIEIGRAQIEYPGWSAHFRIYPWDGSESVPYRIRHGANAVFAGLVREDPVDKDTIVVGSLSCNSNHDRGGREEMVRNLLAQDPDLLFFSGDQSYDHREHTAAWLLWGKQFREVLRDRPVVTIPDDHDIGQPNLWGEGGIATDAREGDAGGYYFPASYVNMVHRVQTTHLPDAFDPRTVARGITCYYTSLNVGGVDFAIVEDRKFKSGPKGKIPQMGPRPDHVRDPAYDPASIDVPGLDLLGERQLAFLRQWGEDWTGAEMKAVLSQTAFAGAVHFHGDRQNRLLADLDSNGWPQSGRNAALREIRKARAVHLCGDQHLAVVVQHGIDSFRDGPFGFTNPAIVNTVYGRWWWPGDERAGGGVSIPGPLPWTGDYFDGFRNRITMYAYANPNFRSMDEARQMQAQGDPLDLADGYALIRFHKPSERMIFECWPRFADVRKGDTQQFPGWPMAIHQSQNDGRTVHGRLPRADFGMKNPVVQVMHEESGEILYHYRIRGEALAAPVYQSGTYTLRFGADRPDQVFATGLVPQK